MSVTRLCRSNSRESSWKDTCKKNVAGSEVGLRQIVNAFGLGSMRFCRLISWGYPYYRDIKNRCKSLNCLIYTYSGGA